MEAATHLKENQVNKALSEFYSQKVFRKLKWSKLLYAYKSEDRFLNNIPKRFDNPHDICIAYGNWSWSTQMKYLILTMGVGLSKSIARKFMVAMVNEFRTSKLCCRCHMDAQEDTERKLFRCLECKG